MHLFILHSPYAYWVKLSHGGGEEEELIFRDKKKEIQRNIRNLLKMGLWKETLRGSHWVILLCILVGIIFAQGDTNSDDCMYFVNFLLVLFWCMFSGI